jgi:hypothetical protein
MPLDLLPKSGSYRYVAYQNNFTTKIAAFPWVSFTIPMGDQIYITRKPMNIGDTFGSWTVINTSVPSRSRKKVVECQCACGLVRRMFTHHLKNDLSRMCMQCRTKNSPRNTKLPSSSSVNGWTFPEKQPSSLKKGNKAIATHSCGAEQLVLKSVVTAGGLPRCLLCQHKRGTTEGQRHGTSVIVGYASRMSDQMTLVSLLCDCGNSHLRLLASVMQGCKYSCEACITKRAEEKYGNAESMNSVLLNRYWVKMVKHAAKRGIVVTTSKESLLSLMKAQGFKCALTGMPIGFPPDKHRPRWKSENNKASLDRIDSAKGYEDGNIQWVVRELNMMKGTLSVERFVELCKAVSSRHA